MQNIYFYNTYIACYGITIWYLHKINILETFQVEKIIRLLATFGSKKISEFRKNAAC